MAKFTKIPQNTFDELQVDAGVLLSKFDPTGETEVVDADIICATTGGISYIINTIRSFCLSSKWAFARSKAMCGILCTMQLLALAFTWSGWISILPVAANIAATIGGYTYNGQKIRIAGMFINSPLWIIYDILVGSWAGILDEIVTEFSMIVSILRYGWKNLDYVDQDK